MKKIICIFFTLLTVFNCNVYADVLGDALDIAVDKLGIEVTDDTSYADKLQNYRTLTNKNIISAAIKNGILVCKNNVLNLNGTDFSPLTDGIVKKTLADNNYKMVCGMISELEKTEHIEFTDDTFYILPGFDRDGLNSHDTYTCVVTRDNKVKYIWVSGEIKQPCIYSAKLYWAEGNTVIVKGLERKVFEFWMPEGEGDYSELKYDGIDEEFVLDNLDKTLYFFADGYQGDVKIYGIGK